MLCLQTDLNLIQSSAWQWQKEVQIERNMRPQSALDMRQDID